MKKLLVMVIALAVVFVMSAGVMAETKLGELPTDTDIPISITAEEMAIIDHDITGFDLVISNLDESVFSGYEDFTITTNTSDISVKVKQEYDNWDDIFGDTNYTEEQLLWNWEDSQNKNQNWLFSPDVWIREKDDDDTRTTSGGYPGVDVTSTDDYSDRGGMEPIDLVQGVNELEIALNLGINYDNDLSNAEWYDFEADKSLNGNIVVTVEAN